MKAYWQCSIRLRNGFAGFVLGFGVLVWLAGCQSGGYTARLPQADTYRPHSAQHLKGVPFFPQEMYQCGPASLASLMHVCGVADSPQTIAKAIFEPKKNGTLSLDLALYPRERGLKSRFYKGSVALLQKSVDAGKPVLIMIDRGFGPLSIYHYMVVVGYQPEGLRVYSGTRYNNLLTWDTLLPQWDRAGRFSLELDCGANREHS